MLIWLIGVTHIVGLYVVKFSLDITKGAVIRAIHIY